MQRTAFPRLRPLGSVIVGLASVVLGASAVAAPLAGNLIGVFEFGPSTVVNDAAGTVSVNGNSPRGELLAATDGNFYVAASEGGANSGGAILRIAPDGTAAVMHSFLGDATEGAVPYSGAIQASDGNLYGTTFLGGAKSVGTVYKMALDGTFSTLYSFTNASQAPYQPYTSLVQGPDGALYGTTLRGGTANQGAIYRIALDGTFTTLLNFTGPNGANPEGQLVVGADNALYGTTMTGGDSDRGTIYKITTTGTYTLLYSFAGLGAFTDRGVATNPLGANPRAGLTLGSDGNFYGTAYQGGPTGLGTVFRATPAGVVTLLHDFTGAPQDGASPLAPVTRLADGTLYGTTQSGGYAGAGTVWRIDPAGTYRLVSTFTNSLLDGEIPYTGVLPFGGYLYGLSYGAPTNSIYGALYKVDLGAGGVPPVSFSISPETIPLGSTATLTWSSPTAATCTAAGDWTDTISTAGTLAVTPLIAGAKLYAITCTDGAGVLRATSVSLVVTPPPAQSVDGGATDSGGGALGLWSLALLGGAAAARRRLNNASS